MMNFAKLFRFDFEEELATGDIMKPDLKLYFLGVVFFGLGLILASGNANASDQNLPDCPRRGSEVENQVDCYCSPDAWKGGRVTVEGSGPYTSYSNVCLSAVHRGVITKEGGNIRAFPTPPQSSFIGVRRNGIHSNDWGSSLQPSFDVQNIPD